MKAEDFDKYLRGRYEDQLNWYDGKAISCQKKYRALQWSVIVLSAVAPVLVAIVPQATRWPAVTISALVAIGTTGLKTFKYQENWINYRTTCETLRKEIHFYKACAGDYKDAGDPESVFVERVESLISRENTLWLSAHRTKREQEDNKANG